MPKDPQEVTIYELRRPLKRYFEPPPPTSPDLQHAAIIIEVKNRRNRHLAYLLQADLDNILEQFKQLIFEQKVLRIKANNPECGTVESLRKKHGFTVIGEQPFMPPKEIDRPRLAKIVRQFRELQWEYYPFNYSAHPIQHKGKTYGINCFGFKDHVLIRLGAKAYTERDVSVMENNPLEPHVEQLVEPWATAHKGWLLLRGGERLPSFKPPDGTMEKPV